MYYLASCYDLHVKWNIPINAMWLCYRFVFHNVFTMLIHDQIFFSTHVSQYADYTNEAFNFKALWLFIYISSTIVIPYAWKPLCSILNVNEEFCCTHRNKKNFVVLNHTYRNKYIYMYMMFLFSVFFYVVE